MTEPSIAPDAAAIARFLRRFADLMSNGQNATYLQQAAVLLDTLTARLTAALDEEQLWQHKYETATRHADALEAECDTLRQDVEGHLDITASILSERDALRATLAEKEAELSGLGATLNRERDELAAQSKAHEQVLARLHAAFDEEREALAITMAARSEELDQLRLDLEREREDGAAKSRSHANELSELRFAFDRERDELQAQLKVRGDELAAFRVVSLREHDALTAKVAELEAGLAERSAFDRVGDLRIRTIEHQGGADGSIPGKAGLEAGATPPPARLVEPESAFGETDAIVPRTMLRQARAQFEYLAKECIPRGDIASQVMCELGAHTMDLALTASAGTEHLPVGEVALSILAPRFGFSGHHRHDELGRSAADLNWP